MRSFVATPLSVLFAALLCSLTPGTGARSEGLPAGREALKTESSLYGFIAYHGDGEAEPRLAKSRVDQSGGIKEIIPLSYRSRYERWKREFLATDAGRTEWESYRQSPDFTLTIQISTKNPKGGTTDKYRWNAAGKLVAATITLGAQIEEGYPNPIYFPVMSSLTLPEVTYRVDHNVLAAAKIAHEFGHVKRTATMDATLYQLQGQLIPIYNKIFLSNGRNPGDPRLIELEKQLGGTPVEIWEDREYWGETNAMLYLRDRFADDGLRCAFFNRIKYSIDLYAKAYEERFRQIARSGGSRNNCWQ